MNMKGFVELREFLLNNEQFSSDEAELVLDLCGSLMRWGETK